MRAAVNMVKQKWRREFGANILWSNFAMYMVHSTHIFGNRKAGMLNIGQFGPLHFVKDGNADTCNDV